MNTISPKITNRVNNKREIKKSNYKKNPSFKAAAPISIITKDQQKIFNIFSKYYGSISTRIGNKLGKLASEKGILARNSRFTLEKGVSSIKPKAFHKSLVENATFPVTSLPLYSANWVLQKAKNVPALKNGAESLYKKPFFRIPRKLNEMDTKTDIIKGMYEKTDDIIKKFAKQKGKTPEEIINLLNTKKPAPEMQQLAKEASEYVQESLYKVSNKFFDNHTGNFNTVYERPLNRIVSGLVPVAFLANDAYNLSVLCGDTKEESKKEAKERQSQEISRVFTTAYIQLLTLGAFTKQVNTKSWFAPLTSAATVLFSETTSRMRLGKPIFFLSKEKAKEYNKKQAEKEGKIETTNTKQPIPATTIKEQKRESNPLLQSNMLMNNTANSKIFSDFATSFAGKEENKVEEKKQEKKPEQKALINFKTLKNGVLILLGVGFAASFIKNSTWTKDSKFVKGISDLGKKIKNNFYEPYAFKKFEMPKSEFNAITKSLKDVGCGEIAQGHEFIAGKYATKAKDGIITMSTSSLKGGKQKEAIDAIRTQFKDLPQIDDIAQSLKTAIKLEQTSIAENKFDVVAAKTKEIMKNRGIVLSEDKAQNFTTAIIEAIKSRVEQNPIKVETKAKPLMDMVTEPFKFIFSAARLPFKLVSALIRLLESPVAKKFKQAEMGKPEDIKKITKIDKIIHRAVTELLGEKKDKAGKTTQSIFVNAMEQLQRQTQKYRKAVEKLATLEANNGPETEIEAAKKLVSETKNKLGRYVNTAVEKSFNGVTQSSNKNTDLAMMTKLASSTVTSAFLVADNYNMVMMKSDGEDKSGAKEKANERIIQRLSALFYQTMFINWFNSTFRSTYNSSLKGMASVVIPNTLTTEIVTRKSIGMPIRRKTYEQIQENEERNENRTGLLGKYFKFMRLLTGKKPLKDRLPQDKKVNTQTTTIAKPKTNLLENKKETTNLIEKYTK